MLWLGIFLVGCAVKWGWATFYAPILMFLLIRYVSGVPFLEEKYKDNEEFKEYCSKVNVFFPWRKSGGSYRVDEEGGSAEKQLNT